MTEYIKRTAVFEQFDNADADVCETDDFGGVDYGFGMKNIKELINAIPAADAEVVVRCKDCKYRIYKDMGEEIGEIGGCALFNCAMTNDDFCSYGEKKDGGDA